jgi:D-glycero-D-manno-heptose 1,7-bisphosphate phosphatase
MTEQQMFEVNNEIFRRLEDKGARPDMFFYCPHHPEAAVMEYRVRCDCRKPGPGMVRMAQQMIDIDIPNSVSIGDKLSDVQLCQNLGGRGILVMTGYGKSERGRIESSGIQPDFTADTLLEAALWLKENETSM